jgi:hypothetical protein
MVGNKVLWVQYHEGFQIHCHLGVNRCPDAEVPFSEPGNKYRISGNQAMANQKDQGNPGQRCVPDHTEALAEAVPQ